ncbi:MAG: DNA helicase RecG, partial [Patescibacteria group bacterium]
VSTSVVEVRVDIPNASEMMIEGAERFGLAQLHQFRGRVGRGEHQSYCLLFTESRSPITFSRLNALLGAKNGFELAEMDLKIRGPGEVYGFRQSGFPEFKIATVFDYALIKKAAAAAEEILSKDPSLESFPLLKQKFETHLASLHLE